MTLCRYGLLAIVLDIAFANVLRSAETVQDYQQPETPSPLLGNSEPVFANIAEGANQKRDLKWPLGVVPYYLDENVYDKLVSDKIRLAMNSIEEASCVQFKAMTEPQHDGSWIHITNPDRVRSCVHETVNGRKTVMVLGLDCMQRRDILHSLMHALGFKDEITNPQREQFVRIKWNNINPKFRSLFHVSYDDFPSTATEYDPTSIMHFHDRAFTKNGQATIAPLIPGLVIDPSRELSPLDKMKLRLMFGHECNRRKVDDLVDVCKLALKEDGAGSGGNDDNNKGDEGGHGDDHYGAFSNENNHKNRNDQPNTNNNGDQEIQGNDADDQQTQANDKNTVQNGRDDGNLNESANNKSNGDDQKNAEDDGNNDETERPDIQRKSNNKKNQ